MKRVKFNIVWEDANGVRAPELAATWARLGIDVCGQDVCRAIDDKTHSERTDVLVSLYPFAEWLTTHWFVLLNEVSSPEKENDPEFVSRHDLFYGSEGFAFPHLSFISEGGSVLCDWRRTTWRSAGIRFLEEGKERLPKDEFSRNLSDFITAVVYKLKETRPHPTTFLEEEWTAISGLTVDEKRFCELAGCLGLDPFSVDAEMEKKILATYKQVPNEINDELFMSTTSASLDSDASWVVECINRIQTKGKISKASDEILSLRDAVIGWSHGSSSLLPWDRGYKLARDLRKYLGLGNTPITGSIMDLESVNTVAGQSAPSIDSLILPQEGSVLNSGQPKPIASRRFDFARALYSLLFVDKKYALLSKAQTVFQQATRAFAAELLAPSDAMRTVLPGSRSVTGDDIERLADQFSVSPLVIRYQIENHKLGSLAASYV